MKVKYCRHGLRVYQNNKKKCISLFVASSIELSKEFRRYRGRRYAPVWADGEVGALIDLYRVRIENEN